MVDPAGPISVVVECPALFLETLPNEWCWGGSRGLMTGNIAWSGLAATPKISGEAHLLDATFNSPPPWPSVTGLNAHFRFSDTEAIIDPLACELDGTPIDLRGRLTASLNEFGLSLTPGNNQLELLNQPERHTNLSGVRVLGKGRSEGEPLLQEALVRGTIHPVALSLTIKSAAQSGATPAQSQTTYFLQPRAAEAKPLLLRVIPPASAEEWQLRAVPEPN